MGSDLTAALVVTAFAMSATYLWLLVCDVARSITERRRWRQARSSAQAHYRFTTTHTDTQETS